MSDSDSNNESEAKEVREPSAPARPRIKKRVIVNVSRCRYESVRRAVEAMGWIVESYDPPTPTVKPPTSAKTTAHRVSVVEGNSSRAPRAAAAGPTKVQEVPADSLAAKLVKRYRRHYDPETSCHIYWHDMSVLLPRVASLRCWQRVNHFPGMTVICRKGSLAIQLNKLQQRYPEICDFFPLSFSLKTEKPRLAQHCAGLKKPKTFIMKPNSGCQGKGIILTRNPVQVAATLDDQDYTVQAYIHRPLLIDGKKFDMRIYVLVTSVTNLTMFVHREGLVRICAHEYVKPAKSNLGDSRIHLTNYAVNKGDESFERCDDDEDGSTGNKRDFAFLERYVNELGRGSAAAAKSEKRIRGPSFGALPPIHRVDNEGDEEDEDGEVAACDKEEGLTPWQRLWKKIDKAIVLTVASGLETVQHNYVTATSSSVKARDGRMCFELLGFDVLVTQSFQPYVVEVNHSPSLVTDAPLDERIKDQVLMDVFRQLNPFLLDVRKAGDHQYGKQILTKQGIGPEDVADPRCLRYLEEVASPLNQFRRIHPCPHMQVDRTAGDPDVKPSIIDNELGGLYERIIGEIVAIPAASQRRRLTSTAGADSTHVKQDSDRDV